MGKYDTKAVIQHILEETGHQKIVYVGHSQGAGQMLCALWDNEDWYADKLSLFIAWAPATKLSQIDTQILRRLSKNKTVNIIEDNSNFPVYMKPNRFLINSWCLILKAIPALAKLETRRFKGLRPDINDLTGSQIHWYSHPNGTSMKALRHWRQIIKDNRFQLYDYHDKNQEIYGSNIPPLIDISKIQKVPIAIMYGKHDILVTSEDVEWVISQLQPNILKFHKQYDYNHSTFLCGYDMSYVDDIHKLVEKYCFN